MKLSFVTPEQWKKLFDFIQNYFLTRPFTIVAIMLFVIAVIFTVKGIRNKSDHSRIIALLCYLGVVFVFSVLNRDTGTVRELRLYFDPWLLESGSGFHESNVLISIVDCLYFIPIGFLLGLNKKHNIIFCLLSVIVLGFSIELIQYVLIRGVASLSDFVSYIAGGILGIILARLVNKLQHKEEEDEK